MSTGPQNGFHIAPKSSCEMKFIASSSTLSFQTDDDDDDDVEQYEAISYSANCQTDSERERENGGEGLPQCKI